MFYHDIELAVQFYFTFILHFIAFCEAFPKKENDD